MTYKEALKELKEWEHSNAPEADLKYTEVRMKEWNIEPCIPLCNDCIHHHAKEDECPFYGASRCNFYEGKGYNT